MKHFFFLLSTTFFIGGCSFLDIIEANNAAEIEIARINANSALMQTQANATAIVASNSIWASQIPLALFVISATIIVVALISIAGKILLQRQTATPVYTGYVVPTVKAFNKSKYTNEEIEALEVYAYERGGELTFDKESGEPILIFQNKKQQLLTVSYD